LSKNKTPKNKSKTTKNKKVNMEIIPEDDMDANKLRNRIHKYITSIRKGCKSIRTWVVSTKDGKS